MVQRFRKTTTVGGSCKDDWILCTVRQSDSGVLVRRSGSECNSGSSNLGQHLQPCGFILQTPVPYDLITLLNQVRGWILLQVFDTARPALGVVGILFGQMVPENGFWHALGSIQRRSDTIQYLKSWMRERAGKEDGCAGRRDARCSESSNDLFLFFYQDGSPLKVQGDISQAEERNEGGGCHDRQKDRRMNSVFVYILLSLQLVSYLVECVQDSERE